MSQFEPQTDYETYERVASEVRADILLMTYAAGSGHPGSSFSSTDLLVWLYEEELRVDPDAPEAPGRDRLVFSKGHASPALYAVLAQQGYFDSDELRRLRETGELLEGHTADKIPGVEFSSGSLGQGLSFAVGTLLGTDLDNHDSRAFVLLGDGELQEGQVWEAALTAADRGLRNLVAIVEHNGAQNDDLVSETKALEPLTDKFEAFGWEVTTCDGHDFASIERAFTEVKQRDREAPAVIIADTVKGNGVSFMEDDRMGFHSTVLSRDQMSRALSELDAEHRLREMETWTQT